MRLSVSKRTAPSVVEHVPPLIRAYSQQIGAVSSLEQTARQISTVNLHRNDAADRPIKHSELDPS